jgi:hypothetical protein
MPEKDPSTYTWLTYLWVGGLAIAGGFVNWIQKVKKGDARPFNFPELFGELATSAFTGVITFYLCEWADIPPLLSAVFIGISGHMGSRAIFLAEGYVEKWAKQRLR